MTNPHCKCLLMRTRQHLTFLIVSSVASSYTDVGGWGGGGNNRPQCFFSIHHHHCRIRSPSYRRKARYERDTNATTNLLQYDLPNK
jgi:hypothetical protein